MEEPEIITQKTPKDEMTQIILSDKSFLVSKSVEEQLVLMALVRDYFVKYNSGARVVKELVAKHNVKEAAAWKLVEVTPRIYSMYIQPLSRNFLVDIHLQKIEETYRVAKEMGDPKSMAMADRNRQSALEKFCGTKELIDQTKLHLPDVEIGFHTEAFKDIPDINSQEYKQIIEGFRKRKDTAKRMEAQDIDYIEVHEEDN